MIVPRVCSSLHSRVVAQGRPRDVFKEVVGIFVALEMIEGVMLEREGARKSLEMSTPVNFSRDCHSKGVSGMWT